MVEICRVLVVESSDMLREFLAVIVDYAGFDVVAVEPDARVPELLERQHFDILLLAIPDSLRPDILHIEAVARRGGAAVIVAVDEPSQGCAFASRGCIVLFRPVKPGKLIAQLQRLRTCGGINCTAREPAERDGGGSS